MSSTYPDRNYLRVRGEYWGHHHHHCPLLELPPRARRILWLRNAWNRSMGTTSACAENTLRYTRENDSHWNYLRVRGEYVGQGSATLVNGELPPRARRIQRTDSTRTVTPGTTSACAENTGSLPGGGLGEWNYLRVRGEYTEIAQSSKPGLELPPRARRIHHEPPRCDKNLRTTSACAENTG